MFGISASAPANCSADRQRYEFYEGHVALARRNKVCTFVIVARDFNEETENLSASEAYLGECCGYPVEHADDGDTLFQVLYHLLLPGNSFRHNSRGTMTRCSASIFTLSELGIRQWRGLVQNRRPSRPIHEKPDCVCFNADSYRSSVAFEREREPGQRATSV